MRGKSSLSYLFANTSLLYNNAYFTSAQNVFEGILEVCNRPLNLRIITSKGLVQPIWIDMISCSRMISYMAFLFKTARQQNRALMGKDDRFKIEVVLSGPAEAMQLHFRWMWMLVFSRPTWFPLLMWPLTPYGYMDCYGT